MNESENLIVGKPKFVIDRPLNSQLSLCKCYVMSVGANRNKSYFSKETIEKSKYSINYIPVVAYVYIGDDGEYHIGGHDFEYEETENGDLVLKSKCYPVGTTIQDTAHFEMIIENGKPVEYLVVDIVLWTGRYPELLKAIYSKDEWFNQSMEINPTDYICTPDYKSGINVKISETEPLDNLLGYTNVLTFEFTALCLLGKSDDEDYDVPPCFPNSKVVPYFSLNCDDKFKELMIEFKSQLDKFNLDEKKDGEKMPVEDKNIDETVVDNATTEIEQPTETVEVVKDVTDIDYETEYKSLIDKYNEAKTEITSLSLALADKTQAYADLESMYNSMKSEYDKLIIQNNTEKVTAVFKKFDERISGNEEYEKFKATTMSEISNTFIDVEYIKNKCYEIVGKQSFVAPVVATDEPITAFSLNQRVDTDKVDSPYGSVFTDYATV